MPTKTSKHLTRRELKREDQIHATLARASSLLTGRTGLLVGIGVAVVAVVAGVLLWQTYQRSQDAKAQKLFSDALDVFHAPVGASTATAGSSSSPAFPTEADNYRKALQQFTQTYQQYSSGRLSSLARYYAAICQHQLKNDKEAIQMLQGLETSAESDVRALARNALAEMYQTSGMNDQAMQTYQLMLKDPESNFPKDALLAAMGRLAEAMGRGGEAAGYYQRLTREHAQSVYTGEANTRLAALSPPPK